MNQTDQLLVLQYGVMCMQTLNLLVAVIKLMIEEIRRTDEKKTL